MSSKNLFNSSVLFFFVSFPLFALGTDVRDLLVAGTGVLSTMINLLLAVGVLLFFWGLVKFIGHAGDEKEHEAGRNLIVWGLVIITLMVTFYSILGFIQKDAGLQRDYNLGEIKLPPKDIPAS